MTTKPVYTAKLYAQAVSMIDRRVPYRVIAEQLGVPAHKVQAIATSTYWYSRGMGGKAITDFPLTKLDLPIRIHTQLVKAGIRTPTAARKASDDELLAIRMMGRRQVAIIRAALDAAYEQSHP